MKSFDATVLGSTGLAGQELVGILETHPCVASVRTPRHEELPECEGTEVVFSALPHGESAKQIERFSKLGVTVIDLSGDLRFPTSEAYEEWYHQPHPAPRLISDEVPYGLPELNRSELKPGTKLVAMPGCYPTAAALALAPLTRRGLLDDRDKIIINALSGYSGRGKSADNFDVIQPSGIAYNIAPYKTGRKHQHVGEIEQEVGEEAVFFAPTVLPIERGLLVQAAGHLAFKVTAEDVREALEKTYTDEPFVVVSHEEEIPNIVETAYTDECHIGFVVVKQTIMIGSSIDNLRKGAVTQAVQIFNLIHDLPEETGLTPKAGWPEAINS